VRQLAVSSNLHLGLRGRRSADPQTAQKRGSSPDSLAQVPRCPVPGHVRYGIPSDLRYLDLAVDRWPVCCR
jgi:hypothetical protein